MQDQRSLQRLAAGSAILAGVLGIVSITLVLIGVRGNLDLMSNQAALITLGSEAAVFFRWGEFLSLFAFYLLFIPVAFYLWTWLKADRPSLVALLTLCGLAGILIGLIGASLRTGVLPAMMSAYPQTGEGERRMIELIFKGFTDLIFQGIAPLEGFFTGVWWLGIGLILRYRRRALGILTAFLGVALLGSSIGSYLQLAMLKSLDQAYFFLPFWVIWLGLVIGRRQEKWMVDRRPAAAG